MKNRRIESWVGIGFIALAFICLEVSAQSVVSGVRTAKYGMQEWAASNLNVSTFRNGDAIPEAKTKEEWIKAANDEKPAWCYFKNEPENGQKYGRLYNWYAINDPRGLAPTGWRIPVNADWMTLVKNLQGVDYAGPKLKSITGWKSKNGINKIGFSALPAGMRDENGDFNFLGTVSQWWSNSEPVEVKKSNLIYSLMLNDFSIEVSYVKMTKESGLSVRCIKDAVKK